VLLRIDEEAAEKTRAAGCPCGDVLHSANYPRRPRGVASEMRGAFSKRFSFCCARDGCRTRATPPSVRFLGRRVYVGPVVVLASALRQGVTARRAAYLCSHLGVSRAALERWRHWWLETLVETPFWRSVAGFFATPPDASQLPCALLERFLGAPEAKLVAMLKLLSPLSGGVPSG
jgi:hypothetical protein